MGEGQGAAVSHQAGEEGPAQNECSSAGKDCGGGQSALEESQSRREEDAVRRSLLSQPLVAVARFWIVGRHCIL